MRNANKSTGPYSIPVAILKATKHVISSPLEIIVNASFSTGIVPDLFKIAKVTLFFKKGVQTSLIIVSFLFSIYSTAVRKVNA